MIERERKLEIGEISADELAEEFDTPLYAYDKETIQDRYRRLEEAFGSRYENFEIHYAVKANSNPEIVRTLVEMGAGLDCASKAEMMLASELVDSRNIIYTGPFNREDELQYAAEKNVTINLDGTYLLDKFDKFPKKICFRVDPGIGKGKHGLAFGGGDTKFGVEEDEVVEAYRKAMEKGAEEFGIHMMTGSCVLDPEYFEQITERLLDIAGRVREELGIEFEFIDIGGGLGIPYEPDEEPLDLEETAERVTEMFRQKADEHDLGRPELRIEPGRFLVAESGVLLTEVTGVKEKGRKTFVGTDTGMHHMIRPMLLDAYHEIVLANDLERPVESEKDVVGPVCSSTDVMAEDRPLPRVEQGNILGIMNAGAYGFTMASHWNSRPLPAEVMVEDGQVNVIREREGLKDLFHGTSMNKD